MYSSHRNRLMFLMLGSLLLAGCTLFESNPQPTPVVVQPPATVQHERVVVREPVLIRDAPPPPRTEVITTAPSSRHIWAPGHWTWRDNGWVWTSGYWELRP